ncbi:prolyl oligopeptidase family serine peptidase [Larkinella arboricola]|uniref:prolyl oligopeptidase family serine peptidase n=1 Tax=Larkinella arboricola TaxID=643671 RepID=UPI000DB97CAB
MLASSPFGALNRGSIYSIAQVRCDSGLGEAWHEDSNLEKEMNTFTDFIACAELPDQSTL